MDTETLVHVDLAGEVHRVGRLWVRARRDKEGATFEYDADWLRHPARFSLEPALTLGPGPFHTGDGVALFGAIGDSAPDRWGRTLMRRMERRRAEREGRTPRALREIDYLLLVDDEARQGALRFARQPGGPFLRADGVNRIPPLIDLPQLLSAAEHVVDDTDTEDDLKLLFAPGSSLGGARPKASVLDRDGQLTIAKFPRHDDEFDTVAWEAVALSLARRAGIEVPSNRIETVDGKKVLLLKRFDREGAHRVPFLSAMSMLGAKDNETRSYLEIVDALRQHGASARRDMEVLWRRLAFIILISNTDDHLRNHGFLYSGASGWRLSPAYDLNPVPADVKPRFLTTAINEHDTTASLNVALETANYFGLEATNARAIAAEVGAAVARWRDEAAAFGLTKSQIERMASAFEHEDLELARKG